MADNTLRVLAGDQELSVWKSAAVSLGIEKLAASFSLQLGRTPGDVGTTVSGPPLAPGTSVRIAVGNETVLVGAVDDLTGMRGEDDRGYNATGRSMAGDLVDCSAEPMQMRGRSAADIIRALTAPFNLSVIPSVAAATMKVETFEVELGEKVGDAILRLCRDEGLLAFDLGDGSLHLTRDPVLGVAEVALRHMDGPDGTPDPENNVIETSFRRGMNDQFSEITVKSQRQATGADYGLAAAQGEGRATDAGVQRHRPLTILADSAGDSARANTRAQWETARRKGLALSLTHLVTGWRQRPEGALWKPGLTVRVDDIIAGVHREMLVTDLTFRFDAGAGRVTELELRPVEAFTPLPVQAADGERQKWDRVRRSLSGG